VNYLSSLDFLEIREGTSSKFTASVVDTDGKLSAIVAAISVYLRKDVTNGNVDTGGKFSTCVNVTQRCRWSNTSTCTVNIFVNFGEKNEMTLRKLSGALRKMIHEKA
jgi:hypothetical protein